MKGMAVNMKAFQLKIMIKNSKPPIWRRVIVPSGITFSQLSMILNEVMGWCGYHIFEFEFYHMGLRIAEDVEEFALDWGYFDYIEASTTYIREYLEENDWFTYTYDLGDQWDHRVTIEKILEDYEDLYPKVVKYKGNCPVEDCGGIYGYYDCLEIISDKKNPEYEERLAWMKSQGYPNEYDMDWVNRELKERFFYKWGKGEKRIQRGLYEDQFAGRYGLNATQKDKNKKVSGQASYIKQMQDMVQKVSGALQHKQQWEQQLDNTLLADIFEDYDKENIVEIAKDKRIKGISRCNKKDLIDKLTAYMLQPDMIKSYFLCLQDEEIKEFEAAARADGLYEAEDAGKFLVLYEAAYIGMLADGRVMVPKDVWSAYCSFRGKDFDRERYNVSYLLCCLRTAGSLYGITPMSVFQKLMAQDPTVQMSTEEIENAVKKLPPEVQEYIIIKDRIYREDLYLDDRDLLEVQGNKEFYIPDFSEIIDFGTRGYNTSSKEAGELRQFLVKNMGATQEEAQLACGVIQMHISDGCEMQDIFNVLDDLELSLRHEGLMNQLISYIDNLWNATRMIVNRGFTPNELVAGRKRIAPRVTMPNAAGINTAEAAGNNIIDLQTVRKNKIYPNEPCPCGSGKKYKNCCRKNKS